MVRYFWVKVSNNVKPCGYCGRDNGDAAIFCQECGTSLTESDAKDPSLVDDVEQIDSRLPLWIVLIANVAILAITLQFFRTTPGAHIRPIVWASWIVVIGVNALPIAPFVLFNMRRFRGRTWPKWAIGLSLTPIPLAMMIHVIAKAVVGYEMAP